MGLLLHKHLDGDVNFGIWEIKENYQDLYSQLTLTEEEIARLEGFGSSSRQLEFLSVRILLKEINDSKYRIVYNENRKPFLADKSKHISISHSRDYTSVLLSSAHQVGIDLEYMMHKIGRVAHKFINNQEFITEEKSLQRLHMYIHWCAKEALYKICDKQDINFKQNLTILPFEPKDFGNITGYVDNKFGHEEFGIEYFVRENYVIAYTYK